MQQIKSYEEWNNLNRRIHKGAKPIRTENGVNFFALEQTYNPKIADNYLCFNHRLTQDSPFITGPWDDMPH